MPLLDCLIVRQPYASLIAYGKKRWEFRKYPTRKTGKIGIAASLNAPWPTLNSELNQASKKFPRGFIFATANLVNSFYVTSNDLAKQKTNPIEINIHGYDLKTCNEPLGEPLEDINNAINNKKWESFAYLLEDIQPLDTPIKFERTGKRSTWFKVEV